MVRYCSQRENSAYLGVKGLIPSNIRHSTNGRSNVKNPISDSRASNVEYSTYGQSNVENPTSKEARFGCQIFDGGQCRIKIESNLFVRL